MPYISNPVYCGVGSVDAVDRASALSRSAQFDATFSSTYSKLNKMSQTQLNALIVQVQNAVNRLPAAQAQQVLSMAAAARRTDPRKVVGLGGPEGALATVANVAAIISSLATVTLGVVSFVDARKAGKEQKELQDRQEKAANAAMAQDLAERKAALAATKGQADALTQKQQLEAQGLTLDADGNVIKKPTSPVATVGAIAAAITGAFMISK